MDSEKMENPHILKETVSQPATGSAPSFSFRWRPRYHLQAPTGWINDPCAPGYDASTGLYHLSFQWNPRRNASGSVVWGSICWGHAISKDMLNWTVSAGSVIEPGPWYDKEGCFTGCLVPTGLQGEAGQLTIFYTGVSRLPLHYTLPYIRSTETLAVAQSFDGGQSWKKPQNNPILSEPPEELAITGWRDPFVSTWSSMNTLLGREDNPDNLYGLISGGIRDRTPTAFLYAVNSADLTKWTYLNAIVDVGLNHQTSRWSGDLGINWECACFVELHDQTKTLSKNFILLGGEGSDTSHPESTFAAYPQEKTKFPRSERSLQWMCGDLSTSVSEAGQSVPSMKYAFGGRFDHGMLYAVNTFVDPITLKQIAWGWVTEEDLPQNLVDQQGWSGTLSLPREISLMVLQGVSGALTSRLGDITSIEAISDERGTFTVKTLGIAPAHHLHMLRKGKRHVTVQGSQVLSSTVECFMDIQTNRFELNAGIKVSNQASRIGFVIFHDETHAAKYSTRIYLVPETETLTIERPDSTQIDSNILTLPERAPFTLFDIKTDDHQERELLEFKVFFDESVLEVFANSRCTFATRVYPATKRCFGISFWAEDESQETRLVYAEGWDGLEADTKVVDSVE